MLPKRLMMTTMYVQLAYTLDVQYVGHIKSMAPPICLSSGPRMPAQPVLTALSLL
jgi:hypothetical protein